MPLDLRTIWDFVTRREVGYGICSLICLAVTVSLTQEVFTMDELIRSPLAWTGAYIAFGLAASDIILNSAINQSRDD